jgi:hypothetical protein
MTKILINNQWVEDPHAGEINLALTLIATHPSTTLEQFAQMIEERISSRDDLPSDDWFTPTINPHKNEWLVEDFEDIRSSRYTFNEILDAWNDRIGEFWYDYASQCVDG